MFPSHPNNSTHKPMKKIDRRQTYSTGVIQRDRQIDNIVDIQRDRQIIKQIYREIDRQINTVSIIKCVLIFQITVLTNLYRQKDYRYIAQEIYREIDRQIFNIVDIYAEKEGFEQYVLSNVSLLSKYIAVYTNLYR